MIRQTAQCDGPDCQISAPTPRPDHYPDTWIIIELRVARGSVNWPTGVYGFHAGTCLTEWSRGRVKP